MKIKTHLKGGGVSKNVNENQVREGAKGLKVKSKLKAGGMQINVNENLVRKSKGRPRKRRCA